MDITFPTDNGRFNYRVAAVMLREDRILAMKDDRSPYFYLPGGRVKTGEPAEDAVLREVREELGEPATIVRPLWLVQSFFTEDTDGTRFHELCLYFLMDISGTGLVSEGEEFFRREGSRIHTFRWLEFGRLKDEYFYPTFLRTEIFHLPDTLTLRTEQE